jgi:hypothetical protein
MMRRDLRRFARQTNIRLIVGALLLLFLVGDGLIYLIYGPAAAGLGFMCILGGLLPVLLVWLAVSLLDWIAHRADRE